MTTSSTQADEKEVEEKKKKRASKKAAAAKSAAEEVKKPTSLMEELLETEGKELPVPLVGDILKGVVISSTKNEVHVDIPSIGTGVIRGKELFDDLGTYERLKVGDNITASVIEVDNEEGEIELSFRKAGREKAWTTLKKLMANKDTITIRIQEVNKGGLMAQFNGVMGFLPVSQLDVEHYPRVDKGDKNLIFEKLSEYSGKEFKVRIIDANQEEDKLIFSEKEARRADRQKAIENYKVGTVVEGQISGTVDFGAFIRFDNLEGLIHISELAWQRIDDPADIVKVGEPVRAQIISIDDGRISLSIKRLKKDPWLEAVSKFNVGEVVDGEVTKITTYGAFVQLDRDIHGLVHISELSPKLVRDPHEVVTIGQKAKFKILSIEPQEHRLGLSLKATTEKAPAAEATASAPATAEVKAEEPAAKAEAAEAEDAPKKKKSSKK